MVLTSDREYRAGQQFCASYGQMDNAKRLFSFGFVTVSLPAATRACPPEALALPTEAYCDVRFLVSAKDPLHALKTAVFESKVTEKRGGIPHLTAIFCLGPRRPPVKELVEGPVRSFVDTAMPLLRVAALRPEDLDSGVLELAGVWRVRDSFVPGGKRLADPELLGDWSTTWVSMENEAFGRGRGSASCLGKAGERAEELTASDRPGLSEQEATRLLQEMRQPSSEEHEDRSLRFLVDQCEENLSKIRLSARDIARLRAGGETAWGHAAGTFSVSRPSSALCAIVRVAEAMAWLALLEESRIRQGSGKGRAWWPEAESLEDWLLGLAEVTH